MAIKNKILYLAISLIIIIPVGLMAQPGLPTTPEQAPIDGGLGILAAAGGAYAVKKMRDRKKA